MSLIKTLGTSLVGTNSSADICQPIILITKGQRVTFVIIFILIGSFMGFAVKGVSIDTPFTANPNFSLPSDYDFLQAFKMKLFDEFIII